MTPGSAGVEIVDDTTAAMSTSVARLSSSPSFDAKSSDTGEPKQRVRGPVWHVRCAKHAEMLNRSDVPFVKFYADCLTRGIGEQQLAEEDHDSLSFKIRTYPLSS